LSKKQKVIFACGREPSYIRNAMLQQSLQQHVDLQLIGAERKGSLTLRLAQVAAQLIVQLRRPHDRLLIGFYGHPLVLLAKKLTRAPIVFDPFVSTYDTLSLDRQYFAPTSLGARLAFALDQQALAQATLILSDTKTHAHFYQQTFQIAAAKFENLYLGCDEQIFHPQRGTTRQPFTVFTYSSYMPLHGVEIIVQAAALCQALPIRFRLVGDSGPTYQAVRRKATALGLTNIEFIPYLPFQQLPGEMAAAAICLGGHFGLTTKAQNVIAGKTYQFMAMAKPVIVGDTSANRELFIHREQAFFVPPGNPQALAEAIQTLYQDHGLRDTLATNAYHLFQQQLSWRMLAQRLQQIMAQL
jgi:glycosyltransferase involved in cell wall biosynthesis